MKQGTVGTYGNESLPNITGQAQFYGQILQSASGAFTRTTLGTSSDPVYSTYNTYKRLSLDASLSSSVYQNNAKVNPDNAEILYVIRY